MVFSRLRKAFSKLAGLPLVDEKEVNAFIKELQRVLIASDVNVRLVFNLTKRIKERALHSEQTDNLNLKEHVLRVVYEELVNLMGESYTPPIKPQKILLVGLYCSGKTTTAGKLAYYFKNKGLTVGLVACDTDRPAAKEQLKKLAEQAGVKCYAEGKNVEEILKNALSKSKEDVLIIDSAGRSAFDDELAQELKQMYEIAKPDEVFLVVSADIGQVAGKQAEAFASTIPITAVAVTKMEGAGRGGGALSAVAATGTKICFIGTGEKINDLELFNAERFVKKLLGMPDFEGLIDKLKQIEHEKQLKQEFTLETFVEQLRAAKQMGPLSGVLQHFGMYDVPPELLQKGEEKMKRMEAMVNSMTPEERRNPDVVLKQRSRAERIARGSGTSVHEVVSFIKEFEKMKKLMKSMAKQRGAQKQIMKLMKKFKF